VVDTTVSANRVLTFRDDTASAPLAILILMSPFGIPSI